MNDYRKHQEVLRSGLERFQAKTSAEQKAFLKRIGILNDEGKLADRYRSPVQASEAKQQAAG